MPDVCRRIVSYVVFRAMTTFHRTIECGRWKDRFGPKAESPPHPAP